MNLRHVLSREFRRMKATVKFYRHESGLPGYVPRGHFYSPLPDTAPELNSISGFPAVSLESPFPALDLNKTSQHDTLRRILALVPEFDWTEEPRSDRRFYLDQGYFKWADSLSLFGMMRLNRPQRVIEVGSGFSSALMLDTNDRFLERQTHFTFIEPYPDRLDLILRETDRAATRIITKPVQDIEPTLFDELQNNDFLFIDSSHVAKFGSDVNYLYFEILPRLQPGVIVHVHDIYWPFEYPLQSIRDGIAWNEAYLLRAFLCFNDKYDILFWTPYAGEKWRDEILARAPAYMKNTGASLWIRRIR